MKIPTVKSKLLISTALASALLTACASVKAPEGSAEVREKLTRLQTNQELASRAPVAVKEAETAVRQAEVPEKDKDLARHRLVMADYKVEIATAWAEARLAQDDRAALSRQAEAARLASRTREADRARQDTAEARRDSALARRDSELARRDSEAARRATEAARNEAEAARLEAIELKRQLEELEGRETERGIIITLGDVLFATGKSQLASTANNHLSKLARFLKEYPDNNVVIEGHTDSVGTESSNITLSQNRADAVRNFLVRQGVASHQLSTVAMGQGSPVASNDSATGRQKNRRVEIIIEKNDLAAAR